MPRRQAPQQRVVKRKLRNSRSDSESPGEEHGQLPNNESSPPDRKRVRRSSVRMDQPANVPQTSMGPQIPGNTMSPGMGCPRAPNVTQMQYYQGGVHAVTRRLAMSNLPGGRAGTPTPGEPPFNQGPGPGQTQFSGSQNNRLGRKKPMRRMPPPSPAGGPPKEQPKDVKLPGPNDAEGSPRNQPPSPRTGGHGPPNAGGGAQVSTVPPTPSARSSSITASDSPSVAVVNGKPKIKPAVADIPRRRENRRSRRRVEPQEAGNFLTTEFMQSVASTLEDFDTQTLFRPKETGNSEFQGINFEEFREWFDPDDLT